MQKYKDISPNPELRPCVKILSLFTSEPNSITPSEPGRLVAVADALGLYCERKDLMCQDDLLITAITALMDDLLILCSLTGIPQAAVWKTFKQRSVTVSNSNLEK